MGQSHLVATGATSLATALALSPLPRFSQLDSLWAAAQALRALRSPNAELLPVLAAAVQVRGRGAQQRGWQGNGARSHRSGCLLNSPWSILPLAERGGGSGGHQHHGSRGGQSQLHQLGPAAAA